MAQRRNQKRKQDGVSRHTRQVRARRRNSTESRESEEGRESLDPIGLMSDSSLSSTGEHAVSDSISRAESSIQEPIDTIVNIQPPPLPGELVALWLGFLHSRFVGSTAMVEFHADNYPLTIGFVYKPACLGLALMLHPVEADLPTHDCWARWHSVGPGMEGPQHLVGSPLSTTFVLQTLEIRCAFSQEYVFLLSDRCSRKLLTLP